MFFKRSLFGFSSIIYFGLQETCARHNLEFELIIIIIIIIIKIITLKGAI